MRDEYNYALNHFYALRPEMCEKRGWSMEETARRTSILRKKLRKEFSLRAIYYAHLDNPLMSDDARLVLMNEVRRCAESKRQGTIAMYARKGKRYSAIVNPYQEVA